MAVQKDPSAHCWLRSIPLTISHFKLCCLTHANTHMHTHSHNIPSAQTRMACVTQSCLKRKHVPNRLKNRAINTGILTVRVYNKRKRETLRPTFTAAVPVSFHLSVESRNSSEGQRQEMRERGRQTVRGGKQRGRVGQSEAESVRDGHVRCPAPQLEPPHTNSEP